MGDKLVRCSILLFPLFLSQLFSASAFVTSLPSSFFLGRRLADRPSPFSPAASLQAVRGGGDSNEFLSINDDAAALYGDTRPVTWTPGDKGADQTFKIGGWSAHRLPAGSQEKDWVQELELEGALSFDPPMPESLRLPHKPRILVLYGSLRPESFSRKLAFECARILERLGCDIRVYNPQGLPLRDPAIESHPKVQELRQLSDWSEGHVWVSPEMHGEITGTFKTQIDWLPLNTGSVRPTQGRTVMIAQVRHVGGVAICQCKLHALNVSKGRTGE
jgi:NAD(P)H-dependent FMN reductase